MKKYLTGSRLLTSLLVASTMLVTGCSRQTSAPIQLAGTPTNYDYVIGPGDQLQLFVWKNPELSTIIFVRPDGKISLPLVDDVEAGGKTPTQLSQEIRDRLTDYVTDPIVTVMPTLFVGPFDHQVRVIGEATKPRALAYRAKMTALDVMIEVGGLTTFAAGNRAVIVRNVNGQQQSFNVKLDNLVRDGDISANVPMLAGDILIIPESWF